jgi:rhomboid family GlyGly-CTERM serine protease
LRTSPSVALFYIIVVTVTVQFLAPVQFAKYDRVLVLEGEVWRLISGVWVHLSWGHLAMNLVGLALVLVLFKKKAQPLSVLGLVATIGTLSHLLLLAYTGLSWGVGLSGALHGLFVYYALSHAWPQARHFALILLVGLGLKLLLEAVLGSSASTWLGGQPVALPLHWAGTAAGLITAAMLALAKRGIATRQNQRHQQE